VSRSQYRKLRLEENVCMLLLLLLLLYFVTVMQHVHGVYIFIMHISLLYYAQLCNVYLFISHARRRRFVIFFFLLLNIEPPSPDKRYCSSVRNVQLYSICSPRPCHGGTQTTRDYYYFHKILNDGTRFKKYYASEAIF